MNAELLTQGGKMATQWLATDFGGPEVLKQVPSTSDRPKRAR